MPRDLAAFQDIGQREILPSKTAPDRFPFPIPNGWFPIARSAEVEAGQVKPVTAVGKELVVFRAANGEARVTGAYCAHLGAHLAVGGRVEGDCIRCPFHGWLYDGKSGNCVEIPAEKYVPKRAAIESLETVERNGLIFIWHHAEGKPPWYEIPVAPETSDPDWLPLLWWETDMVSACEELVSNGMDYGHLKIVHGLPDEFVGDGSDNFMELDGPNLRVHHAMDVAHVTGLGFSCIRPKEGVSPLVFIITQTPIDRNHVRFRLGATCPVTYGEEMLRTVTETTVGTIAQDVAIWENKVYHSRPVFTQSDKDIIAFRKWCYQFYTGYPASSSNGTKASVDDGVVVGVPVAD
ncbi:MAG TPA: Rieske 2Fe-2S domain-containing protein [Labilithrix sp.]|nr:Rieske 2Fe-2S domain-containing protein [Labilithrix sp.]